MKPAAPATAAWANETWPIKPVSTTSDSATTAIDMLVITPKR